MKPGITRWKVSPSKNGLLVSIEPVLGFCQGFLPVARPTKFATVIGALSANRSQWNVPMLVSIVALSWPVPGMSLVYSVRSAAVGGRTVSPPAGAAGGALGLLEPVSLAGPLPTGSGFM